MGKIGDPFTQVQPSIDEDGPAWASDNNAVAAELISRATQLIDGPSVSLSQAEFPHAQRPSVYPAASGQGSGTTWTKGVGIAAAYHLAAGASDTVEWGIIIGLNQRLRQAWVTGRSTATPWSAKIWLVDCNSALGVRSQIGSVVSAGLTSVERLPITPIVSQLTAGQGIVVEWTSGSAAARALQCECYFDRIVGV